MICSKIGAWKRKAPSRAWAMGAALAATAAMMQPAVAAPLPLVDWTQRSAISTDPGTSSALKACPTATPGVGAGQKSRAHGMYQFIKYGAVLVHAPPQGGWQAAADCVAGTPPPPAPVVSESEDTTTGDLPLPPPPKPNDDTVENMVLGLAGNRSEVPTHQGNGGSTGPQQGHAVPAPASGWLIGIGLLAAWGVRRRRTAW